MTAVRVYVLPLLIEFYHPGVRPNSVIVWVLGAMRVCVLGVMIM
jgi:hypothetical protein